MSENIYYDGTKLLSLLDINGNKPEIYMCTSNRSAGKTTYFGRMLVNRFKKQGKKFMIIYRFNYELDDCADKFFKELRYLFFPDDYMTNKRRMRGIYHELYLNDEHCGYAISLNNSDQIKRNSHLFSDTDSMLFDEFQSETNHYCNDEVRKFVSVHTSVARGGGKQVRYLPVYMLANHVTMLNPYYIEMEISSRLTEETKFLRGEGFVLEQGFNLNASIAQKESAFNKAFSGNSYVTYSSEGVYLSDNKAFIDKPKGVGKYICTLKYNNCEYGIREYLDLGIVYCDDRSDKTYKTKITVTTDDHEINYLMLRKNDLFLTSLRYYFEKGCFRFKDLKCKEAVLKALSY